MMNVAHTSRRQEFALRRNEVQQVQDTLISGIAETCGIYWGGLCVGRRWSLIPCRVTGARLRLLRKLGGLGAEFVSCQQH